MSSVGSFGTFTTARLAIYVAQKGLSVTGNNIGNINTIGYTRQRLDQVSFKTGGADRYQNSSDMHVGNGAIAKSVSQLRDPYLDIRYRAEHSSEGFYNGWLNGLNDIATILDEIGKGVNSNGEEGDGLLYAQLSDFHSALQQVQIGSGTEVNDTLAYNSAKALTELFYHGASRLEQLRLNTETQLRQDVNDINDILISIRKLNESIQQAEIYGDSALELRDERNNFIDELSEKVKISATYSMVDIGGSQVEKLTIRLGDANPDKDVKSDSSILVDGNYCAQLTTPLVNEDYNAKYEPFDRKSAAYEQAVKDLKAGKGVTSPEGTYTTLEDFEKAIDALMKDKDKSLLPFRYLDENGEGTNDSWDAAQEFNDYYDITVSDLRDKNGKAWVEYPDVRDIYVKDDTGFPTKAKYEGEFKFSGVWKEGDKITANGVTVKIGPAETPAAANTVYLSADDANGDAKNVSNAIRKAMMASGQFNDYDITTKTTRTADGFTVQLTVKAKEPGEIQGTLPEINISANTTANTPGGVTIGTPTAVNPATTPPSYSASVTAGAKFNAGDTITIGTAPNQATLVVGKDISVNRANKPDQLADALAKKMNIPGYTVTANTDKDGNTSLIFKAASTETPALTADNIPKVNVVAATPVDFTGIEDGKIKNGQPASAEVEAKMNAPAEIVDNGDNTTSKITTRYYMDDNDKWHQVVKTVTTSKDKVLDDNDLYGELQAVRELLTEEGEFSSEADIERDESAAIKRGIPFYQHAWDLLARQFAETMNNANYGCAVDEKGNYLTGDGEVIEAELAGEKLNKNTPLTDAQKQELIDAGCVKVQRDANGDPIKDDNGDEIPITDAKGNKIPDLNRWLEAKGGWMMGGNLFSIRGDTDDATGITAMNITVAQSWSKGDVHVVPTYVKLFTSDGSGGTTNTTQNLNALHMGNLIFRDQVYNPQDLVEDALSSHLFKGDFHDMYVKTNNTLGNDQRSTSVSLQTHIGQALDIDTSRDSVSAVDLNDEAMDLMQYTHSLNAAYRLMTTLDEMLERLITGTGVTR